MLISTEAAVDLKNAALFNFEKSKARILVVLPSQSNTGENINIKVQEWTLENREGQILQSDEIKPGAYVSSENDPNRFILLKEGGVFRASGEPSYRWGDTKNLANLGETLARPQNIEFRVLQFLSEVWVVTSDGRAGKLTNGNFNKIETLPILGSSSSIILHPLHNQYMDIFMLDADGNFNPVDFTTHDTVLLRDSWRENHFKLADSDTQTMRFEGIKKDGKAARKINGKVLGPAKISSIAKKTSSEGSRERKSSRKENDVHFRVEGKKVFADINQDLHIELPVLASRLRFYTRGDVDVANLDFRYKNHQYFFVQFQSDPEKSDISNGGEVILLRDDGLFVLISNSIEKLSGFEVSDDGIFSHPELKRKIDLDRFEAEANRHSTGSRLLTGGDGNPINAWNVLDGFSRDVSDDANLRDLQITEADIEIATKMVTILLQKYIRNPVLIGPASSGKTHILKVMQKLMSEGYFPEIPRTAKLRRISASSVNGGTENTGRFENRVLAMEAATDEVGHLYFFCDELTSLKGVGTHSGNTHNDFFEMLKEALADGRISLASATTEDDFRLQILPHPTVVRRFQKVKSAIRTQEEVMNILRTEAKARGLRIADPELRFLYDSGEYFNAIEAQPGKSIGLADRVFTIAKIRKLKSVPMELIQEIVAEFYNTNLDRILPELQLELVHSFNEGIDSELIADQQLKEELKKIGNQIILGTNDRNKPRGRILLLGEKSVDKKSIALLLHKLLKLPKISDREPIALIQMSEIRGYEAVEKILERIAEAAQRSSEALILLNDFEKADEETQNALLNILDSGEFFVSVTLNGDAKRSVTVDTRRLTIVISANIGNDFQKSKIGFAKTEQTQPTEGEIRAALTKNRFSPEVLDQLSHVLYFRPLNRDELITRLNQYAINILQELSVSLRNPEIRNFQFQSLIERLLTDYGQGRSDEKQLFKSLSYDLRQMVSDEQIHCLRRIQLLANSSPKTPKEKTQVKKKR